MNRRLQGYRRFREVSLIGSGEREGSQLGNTAGWEVDSEIVQIST